MATEMERAHSSGSTIADPDLDRDHDPMDIPSSPRPAGEPDPRNSLRHLLVSEPPSSSARDTRRDDVAARTVTPPATKTTWVDENHRDDTEEDAEGTPAAPVFIKTPEIEVQQFAPGGSGRKNAHSGTTSSIYGGNKMKNIKKEDGIPLWRRDIQFEFLRAVFDDPTPVFTNISTKEGGLTFAEIYIDAMAKSTKTSKILRDKLLSDRGSALNMAMVCLLVNVGRMNTTLNFFPEMRAQLRTYHAIPCLQAQQDPNAYKQLQDAPRLKSILKGACEDKQEPSTIEGLKALGVPRTNPVNLIFVLNQYAPKLTELHFSLHLDFFDLVTRTTLSSRSRAKGFLWLMWWYLEGQFSAEDALKNPFGAGQPPDVEGIPQKLPAFEHLTEEQKDLENVDTEEEIAYGQRKQEERRRIIESDAAAAAPAPKRGKKGLNAVALSEDGSPSRDGLSPFPSRPLRTSGRARSRKYQSLEASALSHPSDTDRTRSASPPGLHPTFNIHDGRASVRIRTTKTKHRDSAGNTRSTPTGNRTGKGRWPKSSSDKNTPTAGAGPQRIILKTRMDQVPDTSSPAPPGSGHPILHPDGAAGGGSSAARRPRPLTAHQIAVERNRQQRVDYLLDRRMRKIFAKRKRERKAEGAMYRALRRHEQMADPAAKSEDESEQEVGGRRNGPFRARGMGGLVQLESEEDDFGEEMGCFAAAVRRAGRRLERWEEMDERALREGRAPRGVLGLWKVGREGEKREGSEREGQPGGLMREESFVREEAGGEDEGDGEELDEMDRELLGELDREELDADAREEAEAEAQAQDEEDEAEEEAEAEAEAEAQAQADAEAEDELEEMAGANGDEGDVEAADDDPDDDDEDQEDMTVDPDPDVDGTEDDEGEAGEREADEMDLD